MANSIFWPISCFYGTIQKIIFPSESSWHIDLERPVKDFFTAQKVWETLYFNRFAWNLACKHNLLNLFEWHFFLTKDTLVYIMAMGFYLHHSGLWCIHQFRISYFSSSNLKKVTGYQRYQQISPSCKVSDDLVWNSGK